MDPPAYFESVRKSASGRWDQLESDPELAGPWHQLFKQVQSPRHVLSELLQNADDAGATEAAVGIADGEFVFNHNGGDFTKDHFASLCRFGYSNKRVLHTIGFRGIGFKSTFSLGDEVRLFTPTLSVSFGKNRFTEPTWLDRNGWSTERTEVRVVIKDTYREQELKKNLVEWYRSPASLLFFKHIRALTIGKQEVRWEPAGEGPVESSEWMRLSNAPDRKTLIIRSPAEEFPEEALNEIRQERMVPADEDTAFPPCRVEIVLGLEGRLFVILPTGVKTTLPFACNAPFVQDPARVKVKDPDTSPTNRWLLARIGELAASSALAWLERTDLDLPQRCEAYGLFQTVDLTDTSLAGSSAHLVEDAFDRLLSPKPFLLTEGGALKLRQGCIAVPPALLDIWSHKQVSALFDPFSRAILCQAIAPDHRQRLLQSGYVKELARTEISAALSAKHLPKPDSLERLLALWAFIAADITGHPSFQVRLRDDHREFRVVPVEGKEVLCAAKEVVRLGDRGIGQSEEWAFLSDHLKAVDPRWLRFLTECRQKAEAENDTKLGRQVGLAYAVLTALNLHEASDVNRVLAQVSSSFFSRRELPIKDCIHLAYLAAMLGATVPEEFQYVTKAGALVPVSQQVVLDANGDLDTFINARGSWYRNHVLHDGYAAGMAGLAVAEWRQWALSDKSRLRTFLPIESSEETMVRSRDGLCEWLAERGYSGQPRYHYKSDQYLLADWDFSKEAWKHWALLSSDDPGVWARVLSRLLAQPATFWASAATARVYQVAKNGSRRLILDDPLTPTWLLRLRQLPCLQDTWGGLRQPAELLRRTPSTEALLGAEPFVRAELDTEASRSLLVSLGVRDTPTGPDRLLDCLRTLAKIESPPIHEVEKWYHRLDQLFHSCSTAEAQRVYGAFSEERLIRTEGGGWAQVAEVFLHPDEADVPEAALVHPSVRHLSLWRRIGVADRPTIELALKWLKSLPVEKPLSPDEIRRVRALLPQAPGRIWGECGHWLNLEGEWVPVGGLVYSISMQSLVSWKHLFPVIRKKTADFQRLPTTTCLEPPFSGFPSLAECLEDRFQDQPVGLPQPQRVAWLSALGNGLCRVVLEEEEDTLRVRTLAGRLAGTLWQVASRLETISYIDGTPVGTPRAVEVLWKDSVLYVDGRSAAKMARAVAQELGRVFGRQEITDAIKLCYDRSPGFVLEYLEENFVLAPVEFPQSDEVQGQSVVGEAESPQSGHNASPDASPADLSDPDAEDSAAGEVGGLQGLQTDLVENEAVPDETVSEQGEGEVVEDEVGEEEEETATRRARSAKVAQPSMVERFAIANGFSKEGPDRYCLPDGTWIGKTSGSTFPWERRSPTGDLLQYYWPKEHCIQAEPLQLEAEIWGLCEKFPHQYSLILSDTSGAPEEVSGHQLKEMCEAGLLVLHPAAYRLVYGHRTQP